MFLSLNGEKTSMFTTLNEQQWDVNAPVKEGYNSGSR
jgi:hypothetical protein